AEEHARDHCLPHQGAGSSNAPMHCAIAHTDLALTAQVDVGLPGAVGMPVAGVAAAGGAAAGSTTVTSRLNESAGMSSMMAMRARAIGWPSGREAGWSRDLDDGLSRDALVVQECARGLGQRAYRAYRWGQPTALHHAGQFGQLAAVRFDDEIDRAAVGRTDLWRRGHTDECSARAYHRRRAVEDLAADQVQYDVPLPGHVLEALGVEVGEQLSAGLQHPGAVPLPARADDAGAGVSGHLHRQGAYRSAGSVDQQALPRLQAGVIE